MKQMQFYVFAFTEYRSELRIHSKPLMIKIIHHFSYRYGLRSCRGGGLSARLYVLCRVRDKDSLETTCWSVMPLALKAFRMLISCKETKTMKLK